MQEDLSEGRPVSRLAVPANDISSLVTISFSTSAANNVSVPASCLLTSTAWAGVWSYPDSYRAQAAAGCCCPLPRWWRMSPRPYRAPLRSASPTAPHQRTCTRTSELMKYSNVTLYILGRGICWWLVCYFKFWRHVGSRREFRVTFSLKQKLLHCVDGNCKFPLHEWGSRGSFCIIKQFSAAFMHVKA